MIRFIVQRHEQDHNSGLERRDFVTLDASVPELERLLLRGGRGEMGFEHWQLLGAELLDPDPVPEPLPYWEPCNPACDPELSWHPPAAPDVSGLVEALERMIAAMEDYEMDVDDSAPHHHRSLMSDARAALSAHREKQGGDV